MECYDASMLRIGTLSTSAKNRPPIDATNPAVATEWLRISIGTGPLAGMFTRSNEIVHTPREGEDGYLPLTDNGDNRDGPAQVRPIRPDEIAARIQHTHYVYKLVKRGDDYVPVPALFPGAAAKMVSAAPDMAPRLRRLRGVIHTPVFRPDGTILTAPGYDTNTNLLYLPEPGLTIRPIPDQPTSHDTANAVELINTMTAGFRWAGEHDRANYYGLLLTPLLRTLVPPPYKLGAIGAPMRGSGKSLLASLLRIVHGGVFRVEMPEDDAEMRKQITSILSVTTGAIVQFDNVSGILRSSTLAGLLTSATWDDRPLGVTDMVSRANDRLWVITGNNVNLGGDLVRRTVWVTIDPGIPDPHLRTDFTIKDLEAWTRTLRGELLHALITLIRAWVVAEKPTQPRGGDSFARWIETVDGILSHAGVPGTFDHATSARQQMSFEDDEWGTFLAAVHRVHGETTWTVKELLANVDDGNLLASRPIPLDALPGELADKATRSNAGIAGIARSLGMWLTNRDGRWAGRLTIRSRGVDRHDKKLYRIQTDQSAGTAGTAGTTLVPEKFESRTIHSQNGHGEKWPGPELVPAVPAVPADLVTRSQP
jgi:hypothetical protein